MKIYVSHSRSFDFKIELYDVLKNSAINAEFIFPHLESDEPFDVKSLFENKGCDLVLAEASYPGTGQGIELGWASMMDIPIISVCKSGSKISSSLKMISKEVVEYSSPEDLTTKLTKILNT
ncbi:MAG TPA: hypothetical protein VHE53_01925 [Patescibacteria group bacterium]|nr:hypothetical protein [Patescibacteria group bacterium]